MTAPGPDKSAALAEILRLMDAHGLTLSDIRKLQPSSGKAAAFGLTGMLPALSRSELAVRLFTYIGGTLIFAGLGTYISMIWDDLASLPRVIITLGSGFTAYIIGLLFAKNPALDKASTPAFLIAALLQPTGLFVLLHEYFGGGSATLGAMLVFGLLTLQQGLTFAGTKRTAPLLFALLYGLGFIGALVPWADLPRPFFCLITGLFYFFIATDLHRREPYKTLSPLFYIIGSAMALGGLYYYTGNTPYDPLFFSAILLVLYAAVRLDSRTLYVLAILNIVSYVIHGPGGIWIGTGWDWQAKLSLAATGISLTLCAVWLRSLSRMAALPLWFFFGAVLWLGGLYSLLRDTSGEVLYIGIAAAGLYIALLLRSRAALAVSILAMIGFISDFTARHFADAVGWPILLIVLGILMLGAGLAFVKLAEKMKPTLPA